MLHDPFGDITLVENLNTGVSYGSSSSQMDRMTLPWKAEATKANTTG
jgi:hypothetical protein